MKTIKQSHILPLESESLPFWETTFASSEVSTSSIRHDETRLEVGECATEYFATHNTSTSWSKLRIVCDPSDESRTDSENSCAETPTILDEGVDLYNRCANGKVRYAFLNQDIRLWNFGALAKRASKRASETSSVTSGTWRLKSSAQHGEVERLHFRYPALSCCVEVSPGRNRNFDDDESTHSSLFDLNRRIMVTKKRLPSLVINAVAFQITRAISHAHGLGVCHLNVNTANIMVQIQGFRIRLVGWGEAPSLNPFSAPEILVSEKTEHLNADIWSIGMVIVKCLRGLPLYTMRRNNQDARCLLVTLFRTLGTPSASELAALDPTMVVENVRLKKIKPMSWGKLLNNRRVEPACTQLIERMLDWNPATRESASSLLTFHYFQASTAQTCEYREVTMCDLTPTEVVGLASIGDDREGLRGAKMSLGWPLLSQRRRTACFKRLETIFEATQFE